MIVVGINAYYEHPSVAILAGGKLQFAAEDERFTGIKHGRKYSPYRTYLPIDALYAGLRTCGITSAEIDEIAYSYNRWDHLKSLWGCFTGRRLSSFRDEITSFLGLVNTRRALISGYDIPQRYRDHLLPKPLERAVYREWNHHLCHAASAFHFSSWDEALVVVADGAGERVATSVFIGRGADLLETANIALPDSLGLLYTFVTRHLGFEPFSDEFKVMGLAAYGEPRYRDEFRQLLALMPEGRYRLDKAGLEDLASLLGPPNPWGHPPQDRHKDIASSLQERLEEAIEHVVRYHVRATGLRRVCVAGGTFMNCVANGKLAQLPEIDDLFVQPAAHDGGTALGAAALSWVRQGGNPRLELATTALGTNYSEEAIADLLARSRCSHERLDQQRLIKTIVTRLASDQVGGLFRGRMEYGSRALGMRSILASPLQSEMRNRINVLKGRESFRPVAPLVTDEAFDRFFEGIRNRYMAVTVKAKSKARKLAPAVVHVDGTSRAQVVRCHDDPFLHAVLTCFERLAGIPILINTSLNVRGKPIVEAPHDALACLFTTDMDFLVLGTFLIAKTSFDH